MSNKYTFLELCDVYNKIEVPIIQRDYAQGRNTQDVAIIRDKFINNFLIDSIVKEENIELDFVYGSILIETNKEDIKQKIFIPLDGQQRLTTLFLLHYLVGVKEKRLPDIKEKLSVFTYETRPSAHDFCQALLKFEKVEKLENIKAEIEDSVWFNEEWKKDPSVSGMLNMLDTLAKNENLKKVNGLLDKLLDTNNQLISFYFTDLEEFGLTENLYIRMNARGKTLTDFENFKSEFFKIIRYNHILLEEVKEKIEYNWVENLWDFRKKDTYVIDQPFMYYLSFITEMLYFKNAEYRSSKGYENDFLNFKVLKDIYTKEEHLKFLIFSLDFIKELKKHQEKILWDGESLQKMLENIALTNKKEINEYYILFFTLWYSFKNKPQDNLLDYIRVVRNLIENTDDNSRREWPRLIASLQNLISDKNVYTILSDLSDENKLIGFNVDQRKEEIFKSNLFLTFPDSKKEIFKIEDNKNFKGRITNILKAPFANLEDDFHNLELENLTFDEKMLKLLNSIFKGYVEISVENFNIVWGNLLVTGLYYQTYESRLLFSEGYNKHPSLLLFAKRYALSKLELPDYLIKIQKEFIETLINEYDDFSQIRDAKKQLYLYYIINERIYNQPYTNFFKNNNFNFGWLNKETGFRTLFSAGIDGCNYFHTTNPIFQVYNQQFRYNLGLNKNNTLDIEIVGRNTKQKPFELIKNWASEN